MQEWRRAAVGIALSAAPAMAVAAGGSFAGPTIAGVPVEFILFAATLAGVALFHRHTMPIAVAGATIIAIYKIALSPFRAGAGFTGFFVHLGHEWVVLANLFMLLLGFGLLARYFEESRVPAILPNYLPNDWKGGFVLLVLVFVLSSFLDNIAAAMIGGAVAATVFRGKVHIGYLAGIVAASNAGGAGSVVGDTTTTMMWISGISPMVVFEAYIASVTALLIFGVIAARQQHALQPIQKDAEAGVRVDWWSLAVVAFILASAIAVNVTVNLFFNEIADRFPFIGVAVWAAIFIGGHVRRPDWRLVPASMKGTIFLLSLVLAASMMPVEELPAASWQTALRTGIRLRRVRQHSADRTGDQAGRLRLGLPRLRGRLWRLDALVRLFRRRCPVQHVLAGTLRGAVGAPRLARGARVRDRLFRDAGADRFPSRCSGDARHPGAAGPASVEVSPR